MFRNFSMREALARPMRTALTLFSGAIGVAAVVALGIASTSARQAFRDLYRSTGGKADFEIVASGGETIAEGIAEIVRSVPGVQTASPVVERPTILYAHGNRTKVLVLALDPKLDAPVHSLTFRRGTFPDERGLALSSEFAERLEVGLGDEVKLLTRRGLIRFKITGLLDRSNVDLARKGELIILNLSAGPLLLGQEKRLTGVSIVLASQADSTQVRQAVFAKLPPGLTIRDPVTRSQLADQTLFTFEQALNLAGGLSLAVAFFITLNAFFMNVAERRTQLAILRVIGATQSQVTRTILMEGVVLGLLSGVVGVPLGIGGGYAVLSAMEAMLGSPLPPTPLPLLPLAYGFVLGTTTAVAAAYVPAWRAAHVSPLESLTAVETQIDQQMIWRLLLLGLGMLLVSAGALAATLYGVLPPVSAIPASILMLIAFIVLFPPLLPALSWGAIGFLSPWLGPEIELARGFLLRSPIRTGLTIAVLFVGVTTSISVGNSSLNSIQAVRNYIGQTIVGDFFVRAMMPDMSTGLAADIPEGTRARIEETPGVSMIEAVRMFHGQIGDVRVVIVAREFTSAVPLSIELYRGDPALVRQKLQAGEVLLGTVLAHRLLKQPGDSVEIMTPTGPQAFRIAGLVTEYTVGGMALLLDVKTARHLFAIGGADLLLVRAEPSRREEVGKRLLEITKADGLMLQSNEQLNAEFDKMIAGVETSLLALLAIGVAVTGIGIVNCLTMNILEQTREFGVLRALGMTRGQLRQMILWNAWIIGTASLGLGVPIGLFLSWIMNGLSLSVFGQPARFAIQTNQVLLFVVLAILTVLLSALMPAQRALRIAPIDAIREE